MPISQKTALAIYGEILAQQRIIESLRQSWLAVNLGNPTNTQLIDFGKACEKAAADADDARKTALKAMLDDPDYAQGEPPPWF